VHVVACMEGFEGPVANTQIDDDSDTELEDVCGAGPVCLSKPTSVEALRRVSTFIDVGCSDESEAEETEVDCIGHRHKNADDDIEEWAANTQLLDDGLSQALAAVMDDDELEENAGASVEKQLACDALVACDDTLPAEPQATDVQRVASSEVPASSPQSSGGWERIWSMLASLGWTTELGPRGGQSQSYYLPPGVKRGPGAKVREDYFDSRAQVLRFLREECQRSSARVGSAPAGTATPQPCAEQVRPRPCANTSDQEPAGRVARPNISSWHMLWAQLHVKGWRLETGPKGSQMQTYYMPPGVKRGPGAKNRIDYFDSKAMVLRHLHSTGAATLREPRPSGRKRTADGIPHSTPSVTDLRGGARSGGSPRRWALLERVGDVGAGALPEDAPEGHVAHSKVKANMHRPHPFVSFRYRDIPFQTTIAAAGSRHTAEAIARACWLKFEAGWEKKDVQRFRDECYRRIAASDAAATRRVPAAKRARPGDKSSLLVAACG